MNYKFVKIDSTNIDDYFSIWVDVLQMMHGYKGVDRAMQIIRQNKEGVCELENMYKTSSTRLDFHHYLRVLEIDGKPVAFVNGIIRYFNQGVFFQIGTFGTLRRYQKHGYGASLWKLVEEELQNKSVNRAWAMVLNQGFWEKQGFIYDNDHFLSKLYGLDKTQNIFYKIISEKTFSVDDFMRMFDEEYEIDNKEKELKFISMPDKR